ncbi:hypothetical protein ACQKWADRAFT_307089 [Trichoderma austrokoningii]
MASGKILVTGAGGNLGGRTIDLLLEKVDPKQLAVITRDPSKLKRFVDQGVSVYKADYTDFDSLLSAFQGVDKIMFVGAHAFTDRIKQHFNVITAARQAGVKHVVYTSIQRREGSGVVLWDITESDTFTEQALRASGMAYTIMMQPAFLETLHMYFGGKTLEDGIRMPFGNRRKTAPVTRDDLAAANVTVLTQPGHENKTYKLSGDEAFSFSQVAEILSEIKNTKVPSHEISEEEYVNWPGLQDGPKQLAEFRLHWVRTMNDGDFEETTGDLERLIGRKPTGFRDYYKKLAFPPS